MSVEKGLFQLIQSNTDIAAFLTTTNGKGVYWIQAPKSNKVTELPYIILQRVDTKETVAMSGDLGFRQAMFQIDCYAKDYLTTRAMAQTVRNILVPFQGSLPDVEQTVVDAVFQKKDWDLTFQEGGVGFVYRAIQEYTIWYYENALPATPTTQGPAVIDGGSF